MRATRLISISGVKELSISLEEEEDEDVPPGHGRNGEGNEGERDTTPANSNLKKDPIRMFGILTPQALRTAQGEAIKMVEEMVPKLVGVSREMESVEIEVRRRRKWLRKAEELEKESKMNLNGIIGREGLLVGN